MNETITIGGIGIAGAVAILLTLAKIGVIGPRKNGGDAKHRTFADDPRLYWAEMREVVTEPLAKVLSETNAVLRELRDRAIREEALRDTRGRSR